MRSLPDFVCRSSAIHKIMGRVGLTDAQEQTLAELSAKEKLTAKQEQTLAELKAKKENPELPATLTTYLKEWYAEEMYGYTEEISSKYTRKGDLQEQAALNFIARTKGLGILKKNDEYRNNGIIKGTPDAIKNGIVIDSKCSWDCHTFLDVVVDGLKTEYYWQMQGYMQLFDCDQAEVWHVLLDTPADANYGLAVDWEHHPEQIRRICFDVQRSKSDYDQIAERVLLCRKWLEAYHQHICTRLGL